MPREVFTAVNQLCCEYDAKFKKFHNGKTIATAKIVNVLISEAVIKRGLISEDFIKKTYGCADPIGMGFTPKARNEKTGLAKLKEQTESDKMSLAFRMVADQWSEHPDPKWRSQWVATAEQWKEKVLNAELVLALANGEGS